MAAILTFFFGNFIALFLLKRKIQLFKQIALVC